MKKFVSLMLILSVILGCVTVTHADEKLEKLTLSVKQRLEIPEKYTEFSTNTRWNRDGSQTVYFEWRTEEDDFINVCATMDGIITDYYNSAYETRRGISKISAEKAVEIADGFMQKINPQIASEYVFPEEDVRKDYGISIIAERFVGKARVSGDQASITLDGKTGEVVSLYVLYTDYDFESQEGVISLDDAKTKFSERTQLSICYMDGKDGKIIPVYLDYGKIYEEGFGLDAFTGEGVYYMPESDNRGGTGGATNDKFMGAITEDSAADIYLTETELKDISKYENYITKEDAEKKLKSIKAFGIENFILQSASYSEKYTYKDDERVSDGMNLSLRFTSDKLYARAVLDAESGEILSFYRNQAEGENKIDSQKAEKIADDFMAEYCNKPYMKATMIERHGLSRNIYFEEVETVPYINNETSVNVDLNSGYISDYNNGFDKYDKTKVVDWSQTIANNMAHKNYINGCEYELVYIDIYGTTAMPLYKIEVKDENEKVYKLFYRIKEKPYVVDALTGELLRAAGEPYEKTYKSFKDIEGHWCETAVNALVDNGFMQLVSPNFNPNDAITVKEANEMLSMASLYRKNIDKKSTENLNRTEAVKAIICGAGYEKVGKLSEIYKPVFADYLNIPEEDMGFVALAKGLGIINGDQNGNFNPHLITTKAAFAVMIYNYILSGSPSY